MSRTCLWVSFSSNTAAGQDTLPGRSRLSYRISSELTGHTYSPRWLSEEEEWRLADLITALKKKDANPSRRKLPVTHSVMNAMQAAANLRSLQEFQLVTMCRVARDALLRGIELTKLHVGNISWNPSQTEATLTIHFSKSRKRIDEPERVIICDYGPAPTPPSSESTFGSWAWTTRPPPFHCGRSSMTSRRSPGPRRR